ncbi:Transposon Tf2-6 polyprotein [Linum perenne]
MTPPKTVKEVQVLAGRITAINRFIPKAAERCAPFFSVLKNASKFAWSDKCDKAFEELKQFLVTPPILASPKEGDELFLYIAISPVTVSAVLVRREERSDQPIFYTSKTLVDAEVRYPAIEKMAYAVVCAARKLRPYFQAHTVTVLTNLPIQNSLRTMSVAGRLAKWAIELSEYDIRYKPRTAIKAQVLADFIVEGAVQEDKGEGQTWTLFTDGASSKNGSGAGIVLKSPEGAIHEVALRFASPRTNNAAEYGAMEAGLRIARSMGIKHVKIFSDSAVVVNQLNGEFEIKEESLMPYFDEIKLALADFSKVDIIQVAREENCHADALSKLATAVDFDETRMVTVEKEAKLSTCFQISDAQEEEEAQEDDWRFPIIQFMKDGVIPEDQATAMKIRRRAGRCIMIGEDLYRKSVAGPYLRCLGPIDADYSLRKVHFGVCGTHLGSKSLEKNLLYQGYYWPTMRREAMELVKKCHKCQEYADYHKLPSTALQAIVSPWPFAQWGMDILGPFPEASGKRKYLIVAIDYFTKWIEAEATASITAKQVEKFTFKHIISRFSIPHSIICDHGTQFDCQSFQTYCQGYKILLRFASVAYPQANGQAEAANKLILRGLKRRIEGKKGTWVEELDHVLWAHRTIYKTSTGESPYTLTYGSEAVLPVEITIPSVRLNSFDPEENEQSLIHNIDMVEERREMAQLKLIAEKGMLARRYNKKLRLHHIKIGDPVLRKIFRPSEGAAKLDPGWEGPFRVRKVMGANTFKLARMDGTKIP